MLTAVDPERNASKGAVADVTLIDCDGRFCKVLQLADNAFTVVVVAADESGWMEGEAFPGE